MSTDVNQPQRRRLLAYTILGNVVNCVKASDFLQCSIEVRSIEVLFIQSDNFFQFDLFSRDNSSPAQFSLLDLCYHCIIFIFFTGYPRNVL